jgi:hypothetical protein
MIPHMPLHSKAAIQHHRLLRSRHPGRSFAATFAGTLLFALCIAATAQVNDEGQRPYLGWSTFSNVTVPANGTYQLEIDYLTSGPRSFFMSVNEGTPTELDLNGGTFSDPVPVVLRVQLHAGTNTISLGNPTGYAPDLDRIVIAPQ